MTEPVTLHGWTIARVGDVVTVTPPDLLDSVWHVSVGDRTLSVSGAMLGDSIPVLIPRAVLAAILAVWP